MPNSVVVYTVRAEFTDAASRERYLEWLRDGHCQEVVRLGGALSGEVTLFDDGSVESRYLFSSRADFDAYETGPAVTLRSGGPEGAIVSRRLGTRVLREPD